ncbi:hypothetical protein P3102_10740 [Amycolatopsis sp. QT-25]|uniref:cucumopine synthase-related protein n=1 Tax=Amycolatopsis sp. QT-25 TaxID=3034022 RepID=UPI0023ECCD7F|nr:hypothetical protein [Amycolatopsis sp. QT-25]WET81644.1 hypothetical protein P3102_10740 [Amycolatopsis sp. QT-25]
MIPEHPDRLREVGRLCWEAVYQSKEVIEVRVTRAGLPRARWSFFEAPSVGSARVQSLIGAIHAEAERSWIAPPKEIVDIHAGQIGSRAGSYNQYFATLVFVNGETRPLGYAVLNSLVRLCQTTDLPSKVLCQITPAFLRPSVAFLGYCGLDKLLRWTEETMALLQELESKAEYLALISTLAFYVNLLNAWNLHFFPWRHAHGHEFYDTAEIVGNSQFPPEGTAR